MPIPTLFVFPKIPMITVSSKPLLVIFIAIIPFPTLFSMNTFAPKCKRMKSMFRWFVHFALEPVDKVNSGQLRLSDP